MAKIIVTSKPFVALAKEQSVIVSRAHRNIKAHFLAHQLASLEARPAAQDVELVLRGTFAKGVPFKAETRQIGDFFSRLFPPRIPKRFSVTTKSLPWDCPSLQVQTREGNPLIAIVDVDPKPSLRTQRSLREEPPGRFLVVAPNTGLTPRATPIELLSANPEGSKSAIFSMEAADGENGGHHLVPVFYAENDFQEATKVARRTLLSHRISLEDPGAANIGAEGAPPGPGCCPEGHEPLRGQARPPGWVLMADLYRREHHFRHPGAVQSPKPPSKPPHTAGCKCCGRGVFEVNAIYQDPLRLLPEDHQSPGRQRFPVILLRREEGALQQDRQTAGIKSTPQGHHQSNHR
jgi:hypothetical protein